MRINNTQLALFAQNTYKRFSELSKSDLKRPYLLLNKVILNEKEVRAVISSGSLAIHALPLKELKDPNYESIEVSNVLYADPEYQSANLSESEKGIIMDFLCYATEIMLTPHERELKVLN